MNNRVLFITIMDMYDRNGNGGVKCSQRNYELMQKCFGKENVVLATFPRKEYVSPPKNAITFSRTQSNIQYLIAALLGCKVYFPWQERKIIRFIEINKIDLIFIDSSLLGRLAKINRMVKKVVFFHNVEVDYAKNKIRNEGMRFIPSYFASKVNEKKAIKYADAIISLNQRDSSRLQALYGRRANYILPITLNDMYSDDEARKYLIRKNRLLFVGSFMPQNQVSIEWFIKEVMAKLTDVTIDIVGKGFEEKKEQYEKNPNVVVIGEVDCLEEYYYSHEIVVIPIVYGAGMKIKTAEALMYGKIVLASDEALEGYEVDGISGVFRCNSADDYINKINELKQIEFIQSDTRKLFLNKYEEKCVEKGFENFISDI